MSWRSWRARESLGALGMAKLADCASSIGFSTGINRECVSLCMLWRWKRKFQWFDTTVVVERIHDEPKMGDVVQSATVRCYEFSLDASP